MTSLIRSCTNHEYPCSHTDSEIIPSYDSEDIDAEEDNNEEKTKSKSAGKQVTFYFREYINGVEIRMHDKVSNFQNDVQDEFDKKMTELARKVTQKVSSNDKQ